jgi:hypothetical protein
VLRPKMLQLPPGDFRMGSDGWCRRRKASAHRSHHARVCIVGNRSDTGAVSGSDGEQPIAVSRTDRTPGSIRWTTGSWFDAVQYCNRLSEMEGLRPCYTVQGEQVEWPDDACPGYRLPTEAEWEYAARADQTVSVCRLRRVLDRVAWHSGNAKNTTHPVAQKAPNAWFLYDMSGNVWEWVWDRYSDSYLGAETQDPRGPRIGVIRVLRGGAFSSVAVFARVAYRIRLRARVPRQQRGVSFGEVLPLTLLPSYPLPV